MTGGRWLDSGARQDDVFSHDWPPTVATRPAWEWVLAWLLFPAFLLDVSVRRLASWLALSIAVEIVVLVVLLFGLEIRYGTWWGILGAVLLAELIGWTIRFRYIGPFFDSLTHGVTALAHAGERSAASLDQLKPTRDRVREGLKGDDGESRGYRTREAQTSGGGEWGQPARWTHGRPAMHRGRTGARKKLLPGCSGASWLGRPRKKIQSARWALDVQILLPFTTQPSSVSSTRSWSDARSDPESGSE